jgi:hypothetical protein
VANGDGHTETTGGLCLSTEVRPPAYCPPSCAKMFKISKLHLKGKRQASLSGARFCIVYLEDGLVEGHNLPASLGLLGGNLGGSSAQSVCSCLQSLDVVQYAEERSQRKRTSSELSKR